MLSALAKKTSITDALKWIISSFNIFFIAILLHLFILGLSQKLPLSFCFCYASVLI